MNRQISRRLGLLEVRAAQVSKPWHFSARFLLVDPEKGLTGVVVTETCKQTQHVSPTPAEVERVRADLDRRRGRPLWNGGKN